MTQQDKDLLIKDLCARLPYGVKARIIICNKPLKWHDTTIDTVYINSLLSEYEPFIRPYLFPMSSMTEEQKKEFRDVVFDDLNDTSSYIDWLNEHHFDYRNLIDKGLAIDATNLNIY